MEGGGCEGEGVSACRRITSENSTSTFLGGSVGGKFECLTHAATIVVNNNKESRVSDPYANYSTHTESHWSASRAPIQGSCFHT